MKCFSYPYSAQQEVYYRGQFNDLEQFLADVCLDPLLDRFKTQASVLYDELDTLGWDVDCKDWAQVNAEKAATWLSRFCALRHEIREFCRISDLDIQAETYVPIPSPFQDVPDPTYQELWA